MAKILLDDMGNGLPQFQGQDGSFQVLKGGIAPYTQIVTSTGSPLFTAGNPGIITGNITFTQSLPSGSNIIGKVGIDGSVKVESSKNKVKDYFSGTGNVIKNYSTPMSSICVINDGNKEIQILINGLTIVIKELEVFDEQFESFTTFSLTTLSSYRAYVRG